MTIPASSPLPPVATTRVRYIKLGPGGCWDDDCIRDNILRIDFDTGSPETYAMCKRGDWQALRDDWARSKDGGTATRFTNETRTYFEDAGDILWVTFAHDRLYWAFLEPGAPQIYAPDDPTDTSSFRRVRGAWRDHDIHGQVQLTKTRLPGSINSASSYRGTSFELRDEDRERLLRRINGTVDPAVERVARAHEELRQSLGALVARLTWRDFETLVDMLFTGAGWRRLGRPGGAEKTKDLDLVMPITGEKAWVQVKSATNAAQFAGYVADSERMEQYDRMFFVFHTGPELRSDRPNVTVLDRMAVVDMVINGGFVNWVIERVA